MSSPSTSAKVNRLVIRYLHFWSVRGDLQEGHDYGKHLGGYASRCQSLSSRCQFLSSQCQFLSSRSPLTSSRAQNRGFCALLPFRTLDFRLFEHKIAIFVRFWGLEPLFSGLSSTKIDFLYYFALQNPRFRAFRAQNWHLCAREAGKAAVGSLKISVYT